MSKFLTGLTAPCILAVLWLLPAVVCSQTSSATLTGTVQDARQSMVPNAAVTVTNIGTGARRNVVTNDDGYFVVPLLQPGTYTVTVEREGFATVLINELVLTVADTRAIAVQLEIKQKDEVVTVEADAVAVKTTGDGMGTTIDRTFVGNLPNNGRSFSSLVLLTPGVTVTSTNTGSFGQFSVNGQRTSTNVFLIDGVSANIGIGGSSGVERFQSVAGVFPGQSATGGMNNLVSQDALEEFKIQTSGYTAESGRQPGAQVQVVTRSGDNQFRGTVFEYFRNEALDARNYFNTKPNPQAALRQNLFGGTFSGPLPFLNFGEGGPVIASGRNRTFFFLSYEGQRLQLPLSGVFMVPSVRLRERAATSSMLPVLNLYPTPTGSETTTTATCTQPAPPNPPDPTCAPNNRRYSGQAPYNYSISNPSDLDALSLRVDHKFGQKNAFFARFNESPSSATTAPNIVVRAKAVATSSTFTAGLNSALGSGLSNEFRFNVSRQEADVERRWVQVDDGVLITPSSVTSGIDRFATFLITYGGNGIVNLSGGPSLPTFQRQVNLVNNVSSVRGAHYVKAGFDYRKLNPTLSGGEGVGNQSTYLVQTEAAVVSGTISSFLVIASQVARPEFTNFSAYLQDTWKVTSRLTFDMGLRWELNPAPTEAEGKYPMMVTGVEGTDVAGARLSTDGNKFYKTVSTAFAPRFGAAYEISPIRNWSTVIRGGLGVFYDLGSGNAASGWPFIAQKPTQTNIAFPVTATQAELPAFSVASVTTLAIAQNLKLPITYQWNLGLEQALGKRQVLSLAYVAAAARNLLTRQILNRQRVDPVSGALLARPNTAFGDILYTYNEPTSDYHSMQTQYRVRFDHRAQLLVNYTWSHAIDEVSSDFAGILERGDANFDVRHNLSAAVHFDVPASFGNWKIGHHVLRGWSLDAIVHAQSGQPFDVAALGSTVVGEVSQSVRPDLVSGVPIYIEDSTVAGGRRLNSAAFASHSVCLPTGAQNCVNRFVRQGSLGRNALRELALYQLDLALGRKFKLHERLALQLKVEAFNVFNHPMFGNYDRTFTNQTFGVPRTTMNTSLGGFSSLYQLGGPRSIQLSARATF